MTDANLNDAQSPVQPVVRNVIHVTLGNDDWDPTVDDMKGVLELFQSAVFHEGEQSVVVTRQGIDVELEIEEILEGKDLTIVKVSAANAYLDQPEEAEPEPDEILEIWPVGKIEGHRLFCLYDEEIFVDVDSEYINKYPLNQKGFYVTYGDGREDFLVPATPLKG